MQLGGLYDPGVEDVGEEAGHAGGQDHAEQGHVVHIYQHLSTHIYSYLHMSTHIYTNLPIPTHVYIQLGQFSVNPPRLLLEVGGTST